MPIVSKESEACLWQTAKALALVGILYQIVLPLLATSLAPSHPLRINMQEIALLLPDRRHPSVDSVVIRPNQSPPKPIESCPPTPNLTQGNKVVDMKDL